ncbi:C40 family peptidase [Coxiella burnetii]|nr:C40 family peptidase [Coxiella burnetii]EAX32556.2 NlpC/P60 domain protein [Coxiella burnetii 'MSU Goat Q177']
MNNNLENERKVDRILPPFIADHIKSTIPEMACGVLVYKDNNHSYIPCKNIADDPLKQSKISDEEYARTRNEGDIIHTVMFRSDESAHSTEEDQAQCNENKAPYIIISWPELKIEQFLPTVDLPLVGRPFIYGVYDCYSLARDYYKKNFGIKLNDYDRPDFWWEKDANLYMENYKKEGFKEIPAKELRCGDLILMKINSPVPNHIAIYLGNGEILHHLELQPSKREDYREKWRKKSVLFLRHKEISG